MSLAIRPARASDLDALAAIEEATFTSDRIARRGFRRLIERPTARLLVAERDGRLAGYALLLIRAGSRAARLYSIAVRPDAGAAGIGGAMMAAVDEAAREAGRTLLRLEVRDDNARARGWYERRGFRPSGRVENYYEDGAAALRFEKPLAAGSDVARDRAA